MYDVELRVLREFLQVELLDEPLALRRVHRQTVAVLDADAIANDLQM